MKIEVVAPLPDDIDDGYQHVIEIEGRDAGPCASCQGARVYVDHAETRCGYEFEASGLTFHEEPGDPPLTCPGCIDASIDEVDTAHAVAEYLRERVAVGAGL